MGGSFVRSHADPAQRVLRAIDIQTGKIAWELPQVGPVTSWGGVLSTATYSFDNRQYVAVAAGSAIIAFGLPE